MKSSRLYVYNIINIFIPLTRLFRLKRVLLCWAGAALGDNVRIVSSAVFSLTGALEIGEDTWVGHRVLVVGGDARVSVGNYCDIAPAVTLVTGSHNILDNGLRVAGQGYSLPITIGNGCWVCAGAVILGGTSIGEKSVVAAGAVVKGDFPPRSLIGGVPARVLRTLSDDDLGIQS